MKARAVIETRMGDGYSLRHVIVDAFLSYKKLGVGNNELNSVVVQLQDLILSLGKQPTPQSSKATLSNSFRDAVKQSIRDGVRVE